MDSLDITYAQFFQLDIAYAQLFQLDTAYAQLFQLAIAYAQFFQLDIAYASSFNWPLLRLSSSIQSATLSQHALAHTWQGRGVVNPKQSAC